MDYKDRWEKLEKSENPFADIIALNLFDRACHLENR